MRALDQVPFMPAGGVTVGGALTRADAAALAGPPARPHLKAPIAEPWLTGAVD
ncbi:hypothetical protein [Planotetraspora sp. GP83]|uniref:hypothetical protein n=1 Tax=Planotetraspora sp. GP83 TaxID=3156264 RepID=UPI003512A56F